VILDEKTPGGTQYPESVGRTWRVTVERLGPVSRALLRLFAVLAPAPIPITPAEQLTSLPHDPAHARQDHESGIDAITPLVIRTALGELSEYSMIKLQEKTLSVHRLVQTAQINELDKPAIRIWAEKAIAIIGASFPDSRITRKDWPFCETLLPHALQCAGYVDISLESPEAAHLLDRIAKYLDSRGRFKAEEPFVKQAMQIELRLLGPNRPEIAGRLKTLALVAMNDSRSGEGLMLAQEALRIYRSIQPPLPLEVARTLNVLSLLLSDLGQNEDAEAYGREALAIFETALESDDAEVASNTNNIAISLDRQERYREAESFYRRCLKIRKRRVNESPEDVALVLGNMAVLLDNQGRFGEADPLYREALPLLMRGHGAEHPQVAALMRKQALSLRAWQGTSNPIGDMLFRLRTGRDRTREADALDAAASEIESNTDI
jgi:tetratricopeptide (TPR) repeat protein